MATETTTHNDNPLVWIGTLLVPALIGVRINSHQESEAHA